MTDLNYKLHIDKVIQNIEDARICVSEHHIVKIVAVSKYSSAQQVEQLYRLGQRAFGENKVQSLKEKLTELEELPLEWHFIGNLQSNKINQLIDADPFLFQSLDTLDLAKALNQRLEVKDQHMDALLQVNTAQEATKSGVLASTTHDVYQEIAETCPRINLRGLMSIGAHSEDNAVIQKSFEQTQRLFSDLSGADILSMGMSADYDLAIRCGSTMVRLGSSIFPTS